VREPESVAVPDERHVVVAVVVRVAAGGELRVEAGEEAGGSFGGDDDRLDLVAAVGVLYPVVAAQVAAAESALVRPEQDERRAPPPGADHRVPTPFAVAVLDGAAVAGGEEQASVASRGEDVDGDRIARSLGRADRRRAPGPREEAGGHQHDRPDGANLPLPGHGSGS
jgi:hypothetical protein